MTGAQSRIAFLRERVEAAEGAAGRQTFDVPFRQRSQALVKIDVPIGFPLYNVRSGRTHRAQRAFIEAHDRAADFFADAEDEEVQAVQHALLRDVIAERNLAEDLQARQQRNPIVLTYDGFIVDGNRRVAALREAGEVENVLAVVLPRDALANEIFETELELQMARETRADYNWIDQALHVRYGIQDLNESRTSVAQRMNIQEREVDDILARLVLVDLYLDWAGYPDAYHRVPAESEQAFIELRDRESRQQFRNLSEVHRQAIRFACFGVIQAATGGYMDVRHVADTLRSQPAAVVTRLRDRLPEELATQLDDPVVPQEEQIPPDDDLLGQLAAAAGAQDVPSGVEVINVVRDPADANVSAPALMDVARELVEEGRETHAQLETLRKVERALQQLRSIHITAETRQMATIAQRLQDVTTEVDRLAAEVGDHSPVDS
jgi:hypothetical protein